jgi:hypothetical protein
MTKDEALRLALDALEPIPYKDDWTVAKETNKAITAIKEALAQPEQPKVRTGDCLLVGVCASEGHKIQPQRTWVGLTDGEIETEFGFIDELLRDCCYRTEAKLKEKNT